jgi:hypothetical protein
VGGYTDNGAAGAAWVFTRSGGVWTPQGSKLVSPSAVTEDYQTPVALSANGNTAIVGSPWDNEGAGAAWVFTRSGGVWTPGSKLVGTDAVPLAYQGSSVGLSADGTTAIVGGVGGAWVFTRSGTFWTQQGSKPLGTGEASQVKSVALSADGNTAIVGGYTDSGDGAWVFTRSGGVWTPLGSKLVSTDDVGAASQGSSVALSADGNTAIVGGIRDNGQIGAAWVFTRSGGIWKQQGNKLVGTSAVGLAHQGPSVALSPDGNTALVGGVGDNGGIGAAWAFTRSGNVWTQQGSKLVGTGAVGAANQGSSVALSEGVGATGPVDGNTAIVGGPGDNGQIGAASSFSSARPIVYPTAMKYPK